MKKQTPELELDEIIYDNGRNIKHEIPLSDILKDDWIIDYMDGKDARKI